jgi:hypothetical protein
MTEIKKRTGKDQVEQRVNEILRVMLDGAQCWDLVDFVREREADATSPWHVGEGDTPLSYPQIRRYVGKAKDLIAKSGQGERQELLLRHLAQRRSLFAKAVNMGDVRAALAVLQDEAALCNLYPARQTGQERGAINIQQNNFFGMTPEQFEALPIPEKMRLLKGG